MKRQRNKEAVVDYIPFSSRSHKQLSVCEDDAPTDESFDTEGIMFRCVEWFSLNPEKMPRSYEEFTLLIESFCTQTLFVDVYIILGHLFLNNVITLEDQIVRVVPFNNNNIENSKNIQIFLPQSEQENRGRAKVSSDFIQTFSNIVSWARTELLLEMRDYDLIESKGEIVRGISLSLFRAKITERCYIHLNVPSHLIINQFLLKGLISIDYSISFGYMNYFFFTRGGRRNVFARAYYMPQVVDCRESGRLLENNCDAYLKANSIVVERSFESRRGAVELRKKNNNHNITASFFNTKLSNNYCSEIDMCVEPESSMIDLCAYDIEIY
jgi:hypothetical protein